MEDEGEPTGEREASERERVTCLRSIVFGAASGGEREQIQTSFKAETPRTLPLWAWSFFFFFFCSQGHDLAPTCKVEYLRIASSVGR